MVAVLRASSSIESLEVDPIEMTVDCTFKDGRSYHYENVSLPAINDVIHNENVSLGKFVNNNCVNNRLVTVTQMLADDEVTAWS